MLRKYTTNAGGANISHVIQVLCLSSMLAILVKAREGEAPAEPL
jgi:hypothetical protein